MINGSHLRSGWHFLRDYALGRIAVCIGTILGAGLLCVTLLEIAPGDPIDLLPNSADVRIQLEGEWGLAGSSLDRIFGFMKRLCLGDLGMSLSYRPGQPVGALLWGPGLQSLGLLLGALSLSIATGLGLGFSTANASSASRQWIRSLSIVPIFLLAHLFVFMINTATFSAMEAGLIFRPAYFTVPDQPSLLRSTLAILILAYGSGALTEIHTTIENAMIQIRKSDHYQAARARGAKLHFLILRHLIPEINNIVVHRLAFFIGGLVILEKVLLLNGAGAIFWNAAELRDYPLVLALSVLSASLVALVRLGAELTNHLLDPRPVGGVLK